MVMKVRASVGGRSGWAISLLLALLGAGGAAMPAEPSAGEAHPRTDHGTPPPSAATGVQQDDHQRHRGHQTAPTPSSSDETPPAGPHQGHGAMWATYVNLGNQAYQHGLLAEAEKMFSAALKEAAAFGARDLRLALSLNNLGELYRVQGRYPEAERASRQALAIRETVLGPDDAAVAESLNNLALLHHAQGQHGRAEPLYRRSLAIWEKTLGPEHPRVAIGLNNLAMVYRGQNQYAQAEPLFRRSLAIRETVQGPEHVDVGLALNNLAELNRAQGRYAEAERLSRRSLKIFETAHGPEHPSVAGTLHEMADGYRAQRRHAEAEALYARALAIWEKALGPNHPLVATALSGLASLHTARGHDDKAEALLTRALAIYEDGPAGALPQYRAPHAEVLVTLAHTYRALGKVHEAETAQARAAALATPR
jgi:tetratricopeptide (TPR) repeat protein